MTEDEAVRLKEGQKLFLDGMPEQLRYCTTLGCPTVVLDPNSTPEDPEDDVLRDTFCLEVFFDYGRSPALCLPLEVCDRLECEKEGGTCAIFDGFPGQVKCIRD
ncbi:hypothetical protein [Archangium sp.]|uniref:hypothetical protein n=1 Tax=Archangium sp. TaxID=1872627 RepID=UPI002EDB1007